MIGVLVFDLGETLVHGERPFPHVQEALTELSQLAPEQGPLTLLLVSDYRMVEPPATPAKIKAALEEYLELLDQFGLRPYFSPVDRRVTLSTEVGVQKPDPRIYRAALDRSRTGHGFDECLAISENGQHLEACRRLGMKTLQFGVDFTDWRQAPDVVRQVVEASSVVDEEETFTRSLREHGQLGEADEPLAPGVTHVVDESGALQRRRFSAI